MATNVLAHGVEIEGTIEFAGDLQIDCKVIGEVKSTGGTLVLNDNSDIIGDVTAGHLTAQGRVDGGVKAETCVIDQTASIKGDLTYKSLEVRPGAQLLGTLKLMK